MRLSFTPMSSKYHTSRARLLCCLLLLTGRAYGLATEEPQTKGFELSTGIGVVASYNAIEGAGTRIIPVPFFVYNSDRFYVRGPQAGIYLLRQGSLQLSADLRAEFQSWESKDAPILAGMDDRKMTAEAGLQARYRLAAWELRAGLWQDVLDRHAGWEATLSLAYNYRLGGRWRLAPRVDLNVLSAAKANYHYGVASAEAAPFRPAYDVGRTCTAGVGLALNTQIDARWSVFADFALARLSADIRRSPLVNREWLPRIIAGLSYRW
jgi:outer membrane protein